MKVGRKELKQQHNMDGLVKPVRLLMTKVLATKTLRSLETEEEVIYRSYNKQVDQTQPI